MFAACLSLGAARRFCARKSHGDGDFRTFPVLTQRRPRPTSASPCAHGLRCIAPRKPAPWSTLCPDIQWVHDPHNAFTKSEGQPAKAWAPTPMLLKTPTDLWCPLLAGCGITTPRIGPGLLAGRWDSEKAGWGVVRELNASPALLPSDSPTSSSGAPTSLPTPRLRGAFQKASEQGAAVLAKGLFRRGGQGGQWHVLAQVWARDPVTRSAEAMTPQPVYFIPRFNFLGDTWGEGDGAAGIPEHV